MIASLVTIKLDQAKIVDGPVCSRDTLNMSLHTDADEVLIDLFVQVRVNLFQ